MILRVRSILFAVLLPLAGAAGGAPDATLPGSGRFQYVCPPCGHVDDLLEAQRHDSPGTCPECGMGLVELPLAAGASRPVLHPGSGAFTMQVGAEPAREFAVYYYRPRTLRDDAPVLIVLPGAGRNAWDYRDHWVDAAECFGVLVLSPHYAETRYPRFWNYNLAGMITDVAINQDATAMTGYRIVTDRQQWLFDDMERIFDHAVRATDITTPHYDLFGHSAGGQFLHRYALFADAGSRAGRIVAANSGWYTVPEADARFPYGLADAPITESQLAAAFARQLVVFLGGSDDASETRGSLVRSTETDRQGSHRLARGRYFHREAAATAAGMDAAFHWRLVVVPGVGHDAKRMSAAAARHLYGEGAAPPRCEALRH